MSAAYLSVAEAAELLGVNHKTIRREIESGRLPAVRVGRLIRINAATLDADLAFDPRDPLTSRPSRRARWVEPTGEFSRLARGVDSATPIQGGDGR
ncbi:MAG TPA: helix-turn-helix domain-containing protein [Gaiellales bacterium]|jgi:excisionase family DNA binding protein|nr:helix-turn-helix domain-containing protein [Gaiellales bacterium]